MTLADLDLSWFRAINGTHGVVLDEVMKTFTNRMLGIAVVGVLALALVWRYRRAAVSTLVALSLAVGLSDGLGYYVIKPLVGRVRPCYSLPPEMFRQIAAAANVGSMPSLHAANAFAVATVLVLWKRQLAAVALPVAALVAYSRVYVGVHWPMDIIAGAAWGALTGLVATVISRQLAARWQNRLSPQA